MIQLLQFLLLLLFFCSYLQLDSGAVWRQAGGRRHAVALRQPLESADSGRQEGQG